MRLVLAVIVGYLLFAMASMGIVGLVMARSGALIAVAAVALLAVVGILVGKVTRSIARERGARAAAIVAGLVAIATIANFALQLGVDPAWYKAATLLVTVPAITLVGRRPVAG